MAALLGKAHARVGLLGNPSDLYGGKVIGFTFDAFSARVTLEAARRFELRAQDGARVACADVFEACTQLDPRACEHGLELLLAALRRFTVLARERLDLRTVGARGVFRLSFTSDIPRQVGLSGSSAIVVAALRVLAAHFADELAPFALGPFELAEQALAAETDELGIVAGPQDRVLQAYEGLLHMDFAPPRAPERYTRLDPALLPPLFLAWDPEPGRPSGAVHDAVRARWAAGDAPLRAAISAFPALVDEGRAALERGDVAAFARCVDANFDARASIWPIGPRDRELVDIGRRCGAAVKFCGSGGAVVGVLPDEGARAALAGAYEGEGYRVLRPRLVRADS
jgi:glucuronokinase